MHGLRLKPTEIGVSGAYHSGGDPGLPYRAMPCGSDAAALVSIVVALLLGGELVAAQAPSAPSVAAPTAEPRTETTVVDSTIEELSTRTMLFDDGTVERETVVRVRPVTDKGVAESGT